jgi:hypothetical protein
MFRAVIPPVSGIGFQPKGASAPFAIFPPKPAADGGTAVQYENLRVVTLPNAEDWVPEPSWLAWIGSFVPPGTCVTFKRRAPPPVDRPYRAVAKRAPCDVTVLVDETENRDSVKWILLHEMAHALVTANPTLAETLRAEKRLPGYPVDDDAHEALTEEKLANAFADRMIAEAHRRGLLGGKPGLDRYWWRERTKGYVAPNVYGADVAGGAGVDSTPFPSMLPLIVGALLVAGVGYALTRR